MNVLVIGGTRFIGPYVVRQLAAAGHTVTLFHRGLSEAELPPDVRRILGDRTEIGAHREELVRAEPDVVVDMMALTDADAAGLVETFRGVAERTVVVSSQDVYEAYDRLRGVSAGPPVPVPLTEDSPLRSRLYPYRADPPRAAGDPDRWQDDYDKILVERAALGDPELPGTVLRLPAVYGPGDYQRRLFYYLKRMADGRPAIYLEESVARWRWSRAYVENVAAAVVLAATDGRAAGQVYNVTDPEAFTEAEWLRRVGEAADWQGRVQVVPDGTLPAGLSPWSGGDLAQDLVADSSRIRSQLGFAEPVSAEEGLRRTAAWERANMPDPAGFKWARPEWFDYATEDMAVRSLTR